MKEKIETIMPPKEKLSHSDLRLLSEANGMTLLQSSTTGKIYAVVKCLINPLEYELKEL